MNSRERVLSAIAHKQPDKVPVDFGAMRSTGITALAHTKLRKYLGSDGKVKVYDLVQQLALPEDDILKYFKIDVVDVGRAFLTKPDEWKDWVLPDGTECLVPYYFNPEREDDGSWVVKDEEGDIIAKMPKDVFYFTQTAHPLANCSSDEYDKLLPKVMSKVSWGGIPSPPYHIRLDDEGLKQIANRAKWLYENTDYAIMIGFGGNLLEWGQFLRGFDIFLMDLVTDPQSVDKLLDRLVEIHLENLEKLLNAVGNYVQIIQFGDDLGTTLGPQISVDMYRRFFKPRHKKMFRYVRDFGGPHLFLHSCGGIRPLIPELIDAGVKILNPVQTSARGMDPVELKKEFGKDITFWGGGCDTRYILPRVRPEDVKKHVRERLEIFADSGGFVFNQVHNITPEVPPENIVAMFEAVMKFNEGK